MFLLLIPVIVLLFGAALFAFAERPLRVIYLVPLLLSFEYRVRWAAFSFDLSELCLAAVCFVWCWQWWRGKTEHVVRDHEGWLVALLAAFAFPAIFLEANTTHAASVYRDFLLPFALVFAFLHAELDRRTIHILIGLACIFAVVNAGLGIAQYGTGKFLWLAGPDEAEWQAYKTGLAKLSVFGGWLGVQDTLPVGLYTGANMFGCFLSVPLCLTTTLAFSPGIKKWTRRTCFAAACTMLVCLLFTMFRSGLLVYVVSMMAVYVFLGQRWSWRRISTVSILALIAGLLFLSQGVFDWDQFGSFEGREEMIASAVALIRARPELLLTGGFTDLYHAQSHQTQEIHNLALYSILQFGVPATALFFTFFIRLIRRALQAARGAAGAERAMLVAITASIAANVFVYGSTTMLIDSVQTSVWLMFWAGVANYLAAFVAKEKKNLQSVPVGRPVLSPMWGTSP